MKYKQLVFDKEQILNLYLDNQWLAYTNDKKKLFRGIENSLDCIGAYDNELLVGLVRTIGDGETIVYIQDILVLNAYQRKGIGKELINIIIEKYETVRQILLTTDNKESAKTFYNSVGFSEYKDMNILGYYYKK
jgi:ribosomal protein S18 acetylase RimI-like enzyme